MNRIFTITAASLFFSLSGPAFAQECNDVLDMSFYFDDSAAQTFRELGHTCNFSEMKDGDGLPVSHFVARWALDRNIGYAFLPTAQTLNDVTSSGDGILHLAARNSNLETILQLIWLGADTTNVNGQGETFIDILKNNAAYFREISSGNDKIRIPLNDEVSYIIDTPPSAFSNASNAPRTGGCDTICELSSSYGEEGSIWVALLSGAPIDTFDNYGLAAIHYAAAFGNNNTIRALVSAGFNIDLTEQNDGQTALHAAAIEGKINSIETLLELGADATIQDNFGATAYQYALDNSAFQGNSILENLREASNAEGDTEAMQVQITPEQQLTSAHGRVFAIFAGAAWESSSSGQDRIIMIPNDSESGFAPPLRPLNYHFDDGCRAAINITDLPSGVRYEEAIVFDYSDIATAFSQQIDTNQELVAIVGVGNDKIVHQRFPYTNFDIKSEDYLAAQGDVVGEYEQLLMPVPFGKADDLAERIQSVIELCR